jgi:hypothetical protein
MTATRVPLYGRLPEIHRLRDGQQQPPGQLAAYLAVVEEVFSAIHDNIEDLYRDHFIETSAAWAIPYIGDLLGVSVLSGDPWTLRADVADAIELRRRKGTIHGVELLAYDLTEWVAHGVELREILAWHQHLNHQRPDLQTTASIIPGVARGGYVPIRDPATLSLLGTPFDPFAHYPDLKKIAWEQLRPNLPVLAIFLWRLAAYQAAVTPPVARGQNALAPKLATDAAFSSRFDIEPNSRATVLFNTARAAPNAVPPVLSKIDEVPGPIPPPRITQDSPLSAVAEYVAVDTYDATAANLNSIAAGTVGLRFHLPSAVFAASGWTIRGANLCAWEDGLEPELRNKEIAVDPTIGRIVFGVADAASAAALQSSLLVTYAYGAVGPVGAQPVDVALPPEWTAPGVQRRPVTWKPGPHALQDALQNLDAAGRPVLISIEDSLTYDVDLSTLAGATLEGTTWTLNLQHPLAIVAADGARPLIRLKQPLAFRPKQVLAGGGLTQDQMNAEIAGLSVLLQGLYVTQAAGSAAIPLIARAAVAQLTVSNCTLDPGSALALKPPPTPSITAMALDAQFGFANVAEYDAFPVTPQILLNRSISGPLLMEAAYALTLQSSIVDAGAGPNEPAGGKIAIGSAADPANGYGPPLAFQQATVLGISRLRSASGAGGIFCHALRAWNNQVGCVHNSAFATESNRLPQNYGCVTGAAYGFTAQRWNEPGYCQLLLDSDPRILTDGPGNDQMGAFGFLLESHKWKNLSIRLRENAPAGANVDVLAVT